MFKKVVSSFLLVTCLWGQATDPYVHRVMNDILRAHIEHKAVTPKLMRRAIKVTFDQFDPARTYLLQEEVDQNIQLTEGQIEQIFADYQQGKFDYFLNLYKLFAKATLRARTNRKNFLTKKSIYQKIKHKKYSNFSKSDQDLYRRQKKHRQAFLRSMGKKKDHTEVSDYYEKRTRFHENRFLELSSRDFAFRMLKSLTRSLDPHTLYYFPEEAAEIKGYLEKGYKGLGIFFLENEKGIFVEKILDNSPGSKIKQVQVGDQLLAINGKEVSPFTIEQVEKKVRKLNGTIRLKLQHKKQHNPYVVKLQKERLEIKDDRIDVTSEPFQGGILGHIRLHSFYESKGVSSEKDIKKALRFLKSKGNLKGLILDLRDNPGGFLTQAVKVAGLFLKTGIVMVCKYSDNEQKYLRAMDGRIYYDGPLVVLTSKGSASCSEIVAGTLQDYGVGLVVGDTSTFGKASIQYQNITDLSGPAYKVTIGRYYTVSGKSPQLEGVRSDIVVPTRLHHYNIGERYLRYPLSTDRIDPVYMDPMHDIDKDQKNWFDEHYVPTAQKKNSFYEGILSKLKERSKMRLQSDPVYQEFLHTEAGMHHLQFFNADYPLNEAFNILADIVKLSDNRK